MNKELETLDNKLKKQDWSEYGIYEVLQILNKQGLLGDCMTELQDAVKAGIFRKWRQAYERRLMNTYEGGVDFVEARILEYYRNDMRLPGAKAEKVVAYIRVLGRNLSRSIIENLRDNPVVEEQPELPAEEKLEVQAKEVQAEEVQAEEVKPEKVLAEEVQSEEPAAAAESVPQEESQQEEVKKAAEGVEEKTTPEEEPLPEDKQPDVKDIKYAKDTANAKDTTEAPKKESFLEKYADLITAAAIVLTIIITLRKIFKRKR